MNNTEFFTTWTYTYLLGALHTPSQCLLELCLYSSPESIPSFFLSLALYFVLNVHLHWQHYSSYHQGCWDNGRDANGPWCSQIHIWPSQEWGGVLWVEMMTSSLLNTHTQLRPQIIMSSNGQWIKLHPSHPTYIYLLSHSTFFGGRGLYIATYSEDGGTRSVLPSQPFLPPTTIRSPTNLKSNYPALSGRDQ